MNNYRQSIIQLSLIILKIKEKIIIWFRYWSSYESCNQLFRATIFCVNYFCSVDNILYIVIFVTSNWAILRAIMPPISANIDTTTKNRKRPTRKGLSEAPPTHPIRPEKNKAKPSVITVYVNICKKYQIKWISTLESINTNILKTMNEARFEFPTVLLTNVPSRNWLTVTDVANTHAM